LTDPAVVEFSFPVRPLLLPPLLPALMACLVWSAPSARTALAQEPSPATAAEREALNARVFDAVWKRVDEGYYDPAHNGALWADAGRAARASALAARTDAELYAVINQLLRRLKRRAHLRPRAGEAAQLARRPLIGWQIRPAPGGHFVVAEVRPGSPAEQADVEPGWFVESIDGRPFAPHRTLPAGRPLLVRLRSPEGTVRELTVTPAGPQSRRVRAVSRREPGILIVKLGDFEAGSAGWLEQAVAQARGATALVLDFQGNAGGMRDELFRGLSCFLPAGAPMARVQARNAPVEIRRVSGRCTHPWTGPMAVLVNQETASAAEVFAAALQEAGRARIVGGRTRGAVLAAQAQPLPDGGTLSLSIANMTTGQGRRLEHSGVEPDLPVETTRADRRAGRDPALEAAIAALWPPP
jgi:carboxyl-terminal processing protease